MPEAKISMYISEGKDEAPSSDSFAANEGWENAEVIRLTNTTSIKVKQNQTYKLLIESDMPTTVDFNIRTVYSEKLLEEGVAFEDFVNYNDRTCYKYIVKSSEQKLRIGAYSFSGNPDIYVHPETIPEKYEDFAFKATEPSDDVIVLTPEDREKINAKKGNYFICIRGNSNTSYRIRIVESDKEYYLEDGIAETNELQSGKEHTFYYTDESLNRDLNLTLTLSVKSGPRPIMLIKFCGRIREDQCIISSENEPGIVLGTPEVAKVYAFVQHSSTECTKKSANQEYPCIYAIEVRTPNKTVSEVTHFSLLAHHNETTHIKLREGISVEQIVLNHEERYYEFVVRDPNVQEVTFSVNSHHGDADIYASRNHKYPDENNFEIKSDKSRKFVDSITFKKEENKTLIGVYYLGIKGYEYSSYSVVASVIRDNDASQIVPTEIYEGLSFADDLDGATAKKYYQFKTYMFGSAISDIKIQITEYIGSVKFYVK